MKEYARRKSARLKNYNYSQNGAYFLTICTKDRKMLLASADIPALVSVFKRFVNRKIGQNIWQRSYYDHVIRGREDYLEIWKYIDENPLRWSDDEQAKTDGE